jgi:diguanylate cyclase (GGDEF)-like protein
MMLDSLPPDRLESLVFGLGTATLLLLAVTTMLWLRLRRLRARYDAERGLDPLTGLCNRVHFLELAERQINHVQRTGRSAAILLIDLDQCQKINEQYGHQSGDRAVQLIAQCAQDTVRDYDVAGRYSGGEVALLLPDTSLEGAHAVARRLREAIELQQIAPPQGQPFSVTITVGISALRRESDTLDDLLLAADAALAEAKTQGRNRTASHPT